MRIAEALALQLDDVTADGLVIRETKFQKSRLLPLHATVRQALDRYLIDRRKVPAADRALFISVGGRSLPYNTVRNVFLQLLDRTGLRGVHRGRDPRIHDLRHSFAVRSLEQCCRASLPGRSLPFSGSGSTESVFRTSTGQWPTGWSLTPKPRSRCSS